MIRRKGELTATEVLRLQAEHNKRHQERMDKIYVEPLVDKMLELAKKYAKETSPT